MSRAVTALLDKVRTVDNSGNGHINRTYCRMSGIRLLDSPGNTSNRGGWISEWNRHTHLQSSGKDSNPIAVPLPGTLRYEFLVVSSTGSTPPWPRKAGGGGMLVPLSKSISTFPVQGRGLYWKARAAQIWRSGAHVNW